MLGAPRPRTTSTSRQRQRQAGRRRRGLVALLLVLVLTTAVAVAGWYLTTGRFMATPPLATLSQAQAAVNARTAARPGQDRRQAGQDPEPITASRDHRASPQQS